MKKFAALLATALVMALSATSVFAAGSVALNENVKANVSGTTTENVSVQSFDENEYGVTVDTVAAAAKTEIMKVAPNATSAELVGVADVTYEGEIPAEGVAITLKVDGIKAGDKVFVIHYTSADTYEVLEATAGDGTVTVTFKSLSPVAIVKYTVEAAASTGDTTTTVNTTTTVDTTTTSPKTGVLPVAAIAAGICLAGAAVCGKKVKFN